MLSGVCTADKTTTGKTYLTSKHVVVVAHNVVYCRRDEPAA